MDEFGLGYALQAISLVIILLYVALVRTKIKAQDASGVFAQGGKKLFWIVSILPLALFVAWYLGGSFAIKSALGLSFETGSKDLLSAIFLWASIFCFLFATFNCFFNYRLLRLINQFFVLPLCIACGIMYYYIARAVVGDHSEWAWRAVPLALSLGTNIGMSVVSILRYGVQKPKLRDLAMLWLPIVMLLASMPYFVPQVIFGDISSLKVSGFDYMHRLLLYLAFIIPLVVYACVYKRDMATKKAVLLYICFSALITFQHRLTIESGIEDLPLQLCNTALYIMPLCIIFKLKRLYYFTYFINVIGALLAMLVPGYTLKYGIADQALWSYFLSHWPAFYIPILMMAFGLYRRAGFRQLVMSISVFVVYFVGIVAFNALFDKYTDATLNFFFVATDFLASKFGNFGKSLWKPIIHIGAEYQLHYMFLVVFLTVYIALAVVLWIIYILGFEYTSELGGILVKRRQYRQDYIEFVTKTMGDNKDSSYVNSGGSMQQSTLKLKGFGKRYGRSNVYAVKDANLEVYAGEIFGFLGPNGAGKSTIIKSIVGIQPPSQGNIEICGYDVVNQDVMAKLNTGYVPDHYALYERLTGREYINYVADIYNVDRAERDTWVNGLVDRFELAFAFDTPMKTYSHGMKQKVAIIAAIVHKPKLWILDEPLTGLDPNSIHQVKETMKEYAKLGNIVFFSSHIIDVVENMCERIAIIKKGDIKGSWTMSEIKSSGVGLENHYLEIIGMNKQDAEKGGDDKSIETSAVSPKRLAREARLAKKQSAKILAREEKRAIMALAKIAASKGLLVGKDGTKIVNSGNNSSSDKDKASSVIEHVATTLQDKDKDNSVDNTNSTVDNITIEQGNANASVDNTTIEQDSTSKGGN